MMLKNYNLYIYYLLAIVEFVLILFTVSVTYNIILAFENQSAMSEIGVLTLESAAKVNALTSKTLRPANDIFVTKNPKDELLKLNKAMKLELAAIQNFRAIIIATIEKHDDEHENLVSGLDKLTAFVDRGGEYAAKTLNSYANNNLAESTTNMSISDAAFSDSRAALHNITSILIEHFSDHRREALANMESDYDTLLRVALSELLMLAFIFILGYYIKRDQDKAIMMTAKLAADTKVLATKAKIESSKFTNVLNSALDGVVIMNHKGAIEYTNPSIDTIFGYDAGSLLGKNIKTLMPKEVSVKHDGYLSEYQKTGKKTIVDSVRFVRAINKKGQTFPVSLSVSEIKSDKIFVGVIRDLTTEEKSKEFIDIIVKIQEMSIANVSEVEIYNELLGFVLSYTNSEYGFIGTVHSDKEGKYLMTRCLTDISWNEETAAFYKDNIEKGLLFRKPKSLFGNTMETGEVVLANNPATDPRSTGVPKGHPVMDSYLGVPILDKDSNCIAMLAIANKIGGYTENDVFEMKSIANLVKTIMESTAAASIIEKMAMTDSLTGCYNRNYFQKTLDAKITQHLTEDLEGSFAILMIDCNGFKKLNDTYGHDAGDEVLKMTSQRIQNAIKKADTLTRVGGDEFIVIATDIKTCNEATSIAQRINDLTSTSIKYKQHEMYCNVSVGIACYNDSQTVNELMKQADLALYEAKSKSYENFVFSKEIQDQFDFEKTLESFVKSAFRKNLFYCHYQPQVNCNTLRIEGVEALLRCEFPDDLINKCDIQTLVEHVYKMGMANVLNEYVVHRVVNDINKYNMNVSKVSINVSPKVIDFNSHVEKLLKIVKSADVAPAIEFELTEAAFTMQLSKEESGVLTDLLHSYGVGLSIDDFGVEYSSLNRLIDYDIDTLKIDKYFIDKLEDSVVVNRKIESIVFAVLHIANTSNMASVAEGVETKAQFEALKKLGCTHIQGYYFYESLSIDDLIKELASQS